MKTRSSDCVERTLTPHPCLTRPLPKLYEPINVIYVVVGDDALVMSPHKVTQWQSDLQQFFSVYKCASKVSIRFHTDLEGN